MVAYNPAYQESQDGIFVRSVKSRFEEVKRKGRLTYKDIAKEIGFSESFARNLIVRDDQLGRVRSEHVQGIIEGLERLEERFSEPPAVELDADLESLVRQIHRRGFAVELRPL